MKVHCQTNLDLYNEEWPIDLPCIPRVGDYIVSRTEHADMFSLKLEVVSVTWVYHRLWHEWQTTIELHIPKSYKLSIKQFYEWYAPKVGKSVSYFL